MHVLDLLGWRRRHADLFAVVDEGSTAKSKQHRGEKLSDLLIVRTVAKASDGAVDVVIAEHDGRRTTLSQSFGVLYHIAKCGGIERFDGRDEKIERKVDLVVVRPVVVHQGLHLRDPDLADEDS